ncbi:MAG TPA: hypothetical protein ENG73_03690 [Desulfobacterales bacterium]|nr:hypothetical protein [Desulfobacterales bacterium]
MSKQGTPLWCGTRSPQLGHTHWPPGPMPLPPPIPRPIPPPRPAPPPPPIPLPCVAIMTSFTGF